MVLHGLSKIAMSSNCDWCDEEVESYTVRISGELTRFVETNPSAPAEWDLDGYKRCIERMARRMELIRRTFGLRTDTHDGDLARDFITLLDIIHSEPPGRDWEDTIQ